MYQAFVTASAACGDVVATVTSADPTVFRSAAVAPAAPDVLGGPLAQWGATFARATESADVQCVQFAPAWPLIAVAADDGSVTVWPMTAPSAAGVAAKPVAHVPEAHNRGVIAVAWHPGGAPLLATAGRDTFVGVIRCAFADHAGKPGVTLPASFSRFAQAREVHTDTVYGLLWLAPTGGVLLSSDRGGVIAAWDVDAAGEAGELAAAPLWTLPRAHLGEMIRGLATLPIAGGTALFASVGRDNAIRVWAAATAPATAPTALGEQPDAHANTVTCVAAWRAADAAVGDACRVATGGGDDVVRVWTVRRSNKAAELECTAELRGHADSVLAVAACPPPDGAAMEVLASGSRDKTVFVWNATAGHPLKRFVASGTAPMAIAAAAFSPDGTLLAASGFDKILRFYDARRGRTLARHAHQNTVRCVVAAPDGRHFVSGGRDKTLCVWAVPAAPAADEAPKPGAEPAAAPVAKQQLPQPVARVAFPAACDAPGRHAVALLAQDGQLAWCAVDYAADATSPPPTLVKPATPGVAAFEAAASGECALCAAAKAC